MAEHRLYQFPCHLPSVAYFSVQSSLIVSAIPSANTVLKHSNSTNSVTVLSPIFQVLYIPLVQYSISLMTDHNVYYLRFINECRTTNL
jgi:hypothetical protein